MSMSQEEIEALMNGLDLDEATENDETDSDQTLSIDEIDKLVSQTNEKPSIENEIDDEEFDLDSLVDELNVDDKEETTDSLNNDEIENLIKNASESNDTLKNLASVVEEIDSKIDDAEEINENETKNNQNLDEEFFKSWTDSKINEGKIPIPAEPDTKVVNQLTQVANDSEEKVSQIFDVLSSTLDTNNDIRAILNHTTDVMNSQIKLLETLSEKFPNISLFVSNLDQMKTLNIDIDQIKNHLQNEDNQIFQAMELMQFNDINRQKIERVMSVIRKLSLYLNNLFEDDYHTNEIAVAKHIHGDDNEVVTGDDLERLIDEFNKR